MSKDKMSLGIAYSVKRKAKGGAISAKSEKRPMPEDKHNDAKDMAHNSGNKPSHNDSWIGKPTVKQAQKPSITRLSQPRMVESGVIRSKLRSDEHDFIEKLAPSSPKEQPSQALNEEGAKRQGPKVHPLKMMAKGGKIDLEDDDHDALEHHESVDHEYGDGAEEDMAPEDSPEDGLDDEETMPVDEFMSGKAAPMLAEGGHIEEDMDNYADDGHEDSIAAAIMSRRDRLHDEIDSGAHDEDLAAAYADGGEVDLSMNADEEPNNEDQMSFEALKKENYSESEGLDDLGDQPEDSNEKGNSRESDRSDRHDRVSAIMAKRSKRQFKG